MNNLIRKIKIYDVCKSLNIKISDDYYTATEKSFVDFFKQKLENLLPYNNDDLSKDITYYMVDATVGYLIYYVKSTNHVYISHDNFYIPYSNLFNGNPNQYFYNRFILIGFIIKKFLKLSIAPIILISHHLVDMEILYTYRKKVSDEYNKYWNAVNGLI